MTATTACPDAARWEQFLDGALSADEQLRLGEHLDGCAACQQALEGLTAGGADWTAAARALERPAEPAPQLRGVMDELKGEGRPAGADDPGPPLSFLAPPAKPGQVGRLGGYEVLGVIGRGGMGVVLKALDPSLGRLVAIKVLAPQWAGSAAARRRFAREAEAIAAVRHEHVVAIHAVAEVDGLPYLVMEYVPGTSLQGLLDRAGPLEVRQVVRLGVQTAAGLAAAHAQGLIHRDVKPSNILLEDGVQRVKLSDFGLARAVDDAGLTQSGLIAGTPQYMAPEQARGEPLDPRADLFSLGSVLYACCTGRPPFRAGGSLAVLRRVCEDTPRPVRDLNPDVPGWLEEIIARLHAKDPDGRFASAAEVSRLLGQHLAHLRDPRRVPPPAGPARRARGWPRVVVTLLVGLGCFAVMFLACLGVGLRLLPRPPAFAPPQPRVDLWNGRVTRAPGGPTFAVDYRPVPGAPAAIRDYVWVVRSGRRTVYERVLTPAELGEGGTLRGGAAGSAAPPEEALETYLECELLIPGQLGWQRRQVSDVVPLTP